MPEPISSNPLRPLETLSPTKPASPVSAPGSDGFASQLREQLERVSQMQTEADESVQELLSGETENITGVFVTARKAQVAFSLLMEIRNKLVDAYSEIRQLRI